MCACSMTFWFLHSATLYFRCNWIAYNLRKDALWYLNYAEIVRVLNEQTLQHILTSDLNSPLSIHVYQNANLTPRPNGQNCTESIVSYSHRRLKHLKPIPNIEIWPESLEVMLEFWYIEHGLSLGYSGYHWHAPSKGFFLSVETWIVLDVNQLFPWFSYAPWQRGFPCRWMKGEDLQE